MMRALSQHKRRGASLATYAAVIGLVALGVSLAVGRTGDEVSGLTARVAGSVNAVDGAISGNGAPVYTGTPPADQAIDQHALIAAMTFTGFSDPEGDYLRYELVLSGGLMAGDLARTRIDGGASVTGTPSATGSVAVAAIDPIGRRATSPAVEIQVTPNRAPTIAAPPTTTVITEGANLALTAAGVDDLDGDTLTPAVTGLPGATATLTGTVIDIEAITPAPGRYTLVVSVTDQHGLTASTPGISVTVAPHTCASLLASDPATPSGTYLVDPDGPGGENPVNARCDMENGGWTGVLYADDLAFQNRWTSGDGFKWVANDFDLAWPDDAIAALRARSTQARQTYVALCEGVVHYDYVHSSTFADAVRFRLHDGTVVDTNPSAADPALTGVPEDGCAANGGEGGLIANATLFELSSLQLPVLNIQTYDSGHAGEQFGSPLSQYPAWFK